MELVSGLFESKACMIMDGMRFVCLEAGLSLVDQDIDADGIVDRLDLDSDNDGILDNIEAQTTQRIYCARGYLQIQIRMELTMSMTA